MKSTFKNNTSSITDDKNNNFNGNNGDDQIQLDLVNDLVSEGLLSPVKTGTSIARADLHMSLWLFTT